MKFWFSSFSFLKSDLESNIRDLNDLQKEKEDLIGDLKKEKDANVAQKAECDEHERLINELREKILQLE